MGFAEIDYVSVIVAALVSFGWGGLWYAVLSRAWLAARKRDPASVKPAPMPLIVSFVCLLVMAWVLAGLVGHIGAVGTGHGILTGFLLWLGFVATTLTVNHRFQDDGWDLTAIDAGHWLGGLVIMGAIIGWWSN